MEDELNAILKSIEENVSSMSQELYKKIQESVDSFSRNKKENKLILLEFYVKLLHIGHSEFKHDYFKDFFIKLRKLKDEIPIQEQTIGSSMLLRHLSALTEHYISIIQCRGLSTDFEQEKLNKADYSTTFNLLTPCEFARDIDEKDKEISQLKQQVMDLNQKILDIDEKDKEISQFKQQVMDLNKKISELTSSLKVKEKLETPAIQQPSPGSSKSLDSHKQTLSSKRSIRTPTLTRVCENKQRETKFTHLIKGTNCIYGYDKEKRHFHEINESGVTRVLDKKLCVISFNGSNFLYPPSYNQQSNLPFSQRIIEDQAKTYNPLNVQLGDNLLVSRNDSLFFLKGDKMEELKFKLKEKIVDFDVSGELILIASKNEIVVSHKTFEFPKSISYGFKEVTGARFANGYIIVSDKIAHCITIFTKDLDLIATYSFDQNKYPIALCHHNNKVYVSFSTGEVEIYTFE